MYIDGQQVVHNESTSTPVQEHGDIDLTAGWHSIEIVFHDTYTETEPESGLIVTYSIDGGSEDVLTGAVLSTTQDTTTIYDDAGRVTEVIDSLDRGTKYAYDGADRITQIASLTYLGRFVFDPFLESGPETEYEYDDNVVTETDALGHQTCPFRRPHLFSGGVSRQAHGHLNRGGGRWRMFERDLEKERRWREVRAAAGGEWAVGAGVLSARTAEPNRRFTPGGGRLRAGRARPRAPACRRRFVPVAAISVRAPLAPSVAA